VFRNRLEEPLRVVALSARQGLTTLWNKPSNILETHSGCWEQKENKLSRGDGMPYPTTSILENITPLKGYGMHFGGHPCTRGTC